MAEICCGVVSEGEASVPCEPKSARRRRMEIRRFKVLADVAVPTEVRCFKRQKIDAPDSPAVSPAPSPPREAEISVEMPTDRDEWIRTGGGDDVAELPEGKPDLNSPPLDPSPSERCPRYGRTSVCGRRREMEDAVSIHPSFFRRDSRIPALHFFGVFDGHGCSHVAMSCKDRMHDLLAEELMSAAPEDWKGAMERSFLRMDGEVAVTGGSEPTEASCRCERQMPHCDAVGSTAVVAVVSPEKIVVGNCGDSRAILCRNGKPVPLTSDHKPDRPDELNRIHAAGGRVIYWDGARVLGMLAMSRAIGDNYLKPYVIPDPELTEMDRTAEDECLIIASDGLWDVVSNQTACDVVRMCLRGRARGVSGSGSDSRPDKACSDAAMLLTKLALARQSGDNVSVVVVDLRRDT
ncbi:hypothetical protein AAC387_Pa11g0527 [Persea americana]